MKIVEFEQKQSARILSDPIYLQCINLATCSKGRQRYGSLLRSADGVTFIGQGYNRAIAHKSFGTLNRIVRQGYSNHAEIEALNDALTKGNNVKGAEIFVGGYFPEMKGLLYLKNEFSCLRCPPILANYGISIIHVPTPDGWITKSVTEAILEAKKYTKGGTYVNRVQSVLVYYTLEDLLTPVLTE